MTPTGHEDEFRRLFAREARDAPRLAGRAGRWSSSARRRPRARRADVPRRAHAQGRRRASSASPTVSGSCTSWSSCWTSCAPAGASPAARSPTRVLGAVDGLRAMIAAAMAGDATVAGRRPRRAVRAALAKAAPRARPRRGAVAGRPAPERGRGGRRARGARARAAAAAPVARRPARGDPGAGRTGSTARAARRRGRGRAAARRAAALRPARRRARPTSTSTASWRSALGELQEQTMRARMVSVATIAGPLRRAVRDIAHDRGKQVRWELAGESTELDRHVLEQLREPLVALVRNAADHGIEAPAERAAPASRARAASACTRCSSAPRSSSASPTTGAGSTPSACARATGGSTRRRARGDLPPRGLDRRDRDRGLRPRRRPRRRAHRGRRAARPRRGALASPARGRSSASACR